MSAAALTLAGPASAVGKIGPRMTISNELYKGYCPDADTNTHWNRSPGGAVVQLWSCNGRPQQQWDVNFIDRPANTNRTVGNEQVIVQIRNHYDGNCLDADTNSQHNFGIIQRWPCASPSQVEKSGASQGWYIAPGLPATRSGRNGPQYAGLHTVWGYCLDADSNPFYQHRGIYNGVHIQQWKCNGTPQQAWLTQR
jgi:hypothetical protein